jgi:hypothetical protein
MKVMPAYAARAVFDDEPSYRNACRWREGDPITLELEDGSTAVCRFLRLEGCEAVLTVLTPPS